jgi:hypothetical protein
MCYSFVRGGSFSLATHEQARWLREAELKHCRVAMLATLGCIVQDVFKFPGAATVYSGDLKLTKLHDAAVEQGTMGQMLVWLSFFEIFGTAATIQMLQVCAFYFVCCVIPLLSVPFRSI